MKLTKIMDFDRFVRQVLLVIVNSHTEQHSELNAIKRHLNGYSRTSYSINSQNSAFDKNTTRRQRVKISEFQENASASSTFARGWACF